MFRSGFRKETRARVSQSINFQNLRLWFKLILYDEIF